MKQEGHSVLMNVTHFDPYFYVPCPRGFTSNDLEPFKNYLNVRPLDRSYVPTLICLCRKFRGVTTLYGQNSSRNRLFLVIKGTRSSTSSESPQPTRGTFPKFEISHSNPFKSIDLIFPHASSKELNAPTKNFFLGSFRPSKATSYTPFAS